MTAYQDYQDDIDDLDDDLAQDELDVKADDFDSAVSSALADAAATAPKYQAGDDDKPEPIMFEGRVVDRTDIKISGLTGLSEAYEGLKIGLDDRVRLVVETRAVRVNHYTDKDGQLIRSQELKVVVADIVPWNPLDPSDDGVIRS
jgi:hypothetical protein